MTLRDIFKKKHDIEKNGQDISAKSSDEKAVPYQTEFTFLRTTTSDQEVIQPPSYPGDQEKIPHKSPLPASPDPSRKRRSFFHPKRSSSPPSDNPPRPTSSSPPTRPKTDRKLSDRFSTLRLSSSRQSSRESVHLPSSPAPDPIPAPLSPDVLSAKKSNPLDSNVLTQQEAQWEARATQLALSSAVLPNASRTPRPNPSAATSSSLRGVASQIGSVAGSSSPGTATSARTEEEQKSDEETLHRAITLHETGELAESTALFGLLASPSGANSALAQVLYGLALRHGWGCTVSPEEGVHFLSLAAKNSASIESQALKAGMHKGGAAKGELVLAIFELANCYRYGWGVGKDARAAREFYETAANLGDLDAMEEAAWCFMEGFGGAKNKGVAARYLRRAEEGGGRGWGRVGFGRTSIIPSDEGWGDLLDGSHSNRRNDCGFSMAFLGYITG